MGSRGRPRTIGAAIAACCLVSFSAAPAAVAAEKKAPTAEKKVPTAEKKVPTAEKKAPTASRGARSAKAAPRKIERLVCKLGTEDNHARIAVELLNGKVNEVAYYSIWKPRTCSLHVQRGDPYSKWEEFKAVMTITLIEEKGAVLAEHSPSKVHFIFRDIDRMRYCGAEGKINGTLTVMRGKPECVLSGVMDDDPSKPREPARAADPAELKEASEAAKQPPVPDKSP